MYVDVDSADSIFFFVQGFYFCKSVNMKLDADDELFREHFYHWLEAHNEIPKLPTWGHQLKLIAERKNTSAWMVFMDEFSRFMAVHGH